MCFIHCQKERGRDREMERQRDGERERGGDKSSFI
jgi:hypothetical protein